MDLKNKKFWKSGLESIQEYNLEKTEILNLKIRNTRIKIINNENSELKTKKICKMSLKYI